MTTVADLDRSLQTFEAHLRRQKRLAFVLTAVPTLLALLLIGLSIWMEEHARVRAARFQREADQSASVLRATETELVLRRKELQDVEAKARATGAALDRTRLAADSLSRASRSLALKLFYRGDYNGAIAAYDSALSKDPDNAYLLNLKGYAQFRAKRYEEARATLTEAAAKDPGYAWAYFDRARVECAAGDFSAARVALQKTVEVSPPMASVIQSDGELQRLCRPILKPT
jgi:tetratricopeptide (TPR) repeat protein